VERLRAVSGDDTAVLVDPTMTVTADLPGHTVGATPIVLRPEVVVAFHGLCLVKCVDDDDWYMGTRYDDGSILCWSAYPDLDQAVRGL
jgi:hypothetical protein